MWVSTRSCRRSENTSDGKLTYQYGNIIRTFIDPVARTKDSVTGEYYSGVPHYQPIRHSDGTAVRDREGGDYPFRLITYKTVHHGQARTNVNPWLMLIIPENPVEISATDAARLEVETGDRVRVSSPSNRRGIEGKAREQHSRPHFVDGVATGHDPSRGAGIQSTQIMRTDRRYTNVSLQEKIGASCSFYDTWVRVRKV
jgi:anaerobic selenocysteine-containing dehydrogenase